MKRLALQILAMAISIGANALETAVLLDDGTAKELLGGKSIATHAGGFVPVSFDTVVSNLSAPDLHRVLPAEFTRSVSRKGTAGFPIVATQPRHYRYTNEKGRKTEIVELYRKQTEPGVFDIVLKASGKRFFGKYTVMVHVRVMKADNAGIVYLADIHAYPHNGPLRFFARRLGVVERYFEKNTRNIEWTARKIGMGLDEQPAFRRERKQATAPAYLSAHSGA